MALNSSVRDYQLYEFSILMYSSNFEQERTFRPSGLVPILDESWNIETKTFNRGKEIKAVSSLS